MQTWITLTPEQRMVARDQYRNLQRISPEKREALREKWNAYQDLPSEEKQRFTEAAAKPATKPVIPKIGAPPIKPLSAPLPPRATARKITVPPPPPAAPPAPAIVPPASPPTAAVMVEPGTASTVPAIAPTKP